MGISIVGLRLQMPCIFVIAEGNCTNNDSIYQMLWNRMKENVNITIYFIFMV